MANVQRRVYPLLSPHENLKPPPLVYRVDNKEMMTAGFLKPGFEKLEGLFESAVSNSNNAGAALSVRVDGELVASLWGGYAAPGRKWEESTPSVVFSATKGIATILLANQVMLGAIELDEPVAKFWPEFGQRGKEAITVRELLAHKAGLSALRENLSLEQVLNWDFMVDILAKAEPLFDKSRHQYHAITFGWLVGELLRRVTGLGVGALLQQVITSPLGIKGWIGAPNDVLGKIAILQQIQQAPAQNLPELQTKAMTLGNAFPGNLIGPGEGFNNPKVQMAELAGVGGIFDANGLSKIYSACVSNHEPVRLMSDSVIRDMTKVQSEGPSHLEKEPPFAKWGSGFTLSSDRRYLLTDHSFGHDGYGGQIAFGDPIHKVGFAFITNDLQVANDQRGDGLVAAVREILG